MSMNFNILMVSKEQIIEENISLRLGAIQVLRNADGGGGCLIFWKKALQRCNVQYY